MIFFQAKGYNFTVIKKLRVKNYKSLADVNLELPRLAILIGPNNSGKSNLLDVLRVLKHMARGGGDISESSEYGEDAIDVFKRTNAILGRDCVWSNAGEESVDIVVDSGFGDVTVSYDLGLRPLSLHQSLYPLREALEIKENEDLKILIKRHNWDVHLVFPSGAGAPMTEDSIAHMSSLAWSMLRTEYWEEDKRVKRDYLETIKLFKRDLRETLILFIDPDSARQPRVVSEKPEIGESGIGLVVLLDHLLATDRKTFDAMVKSLSDSIKEIEDIKLLPGGSGTKMVGLKEIGLREPIPATHLSDGLMRLLVFYALAYSPVSPRIIAIEEPEDGINPRLLGVLLELFRDMTSSGKHQIIITTHSKLLMDMARKEEIITVQKRNGASQFVPLAEHPHIDEFLEDLTIGSLHYSGEI